MKGNVHKAFIASLVAIVVFVLIFLVLDGFDYYRLSLDNRFFHQKHDLIKPSGLWGHGYGIIGSLLIIIGVSSYMLRKRIRRLSRAGLLKHWLEFHIFLCVLGPILILFHTAFKFGGIVAVSFWSMVAVVLSGVIGRFIYIQIPRSVEGRELTQGELALMQTDLKVDLLDAKHMEEKINALLKNTIENHSSVKSSVLVTRVIRRFFSDRRLQQNLRRQIRAYRMTSRDTSIVLKTLKREITLSRKIDLLSSMQNLLRYWHVAHLPFALVMLLIMLIHVGIVVVFGYTWIF